MAAYNYLQLTNSVLRRLREPEATSVNDNDYVKLIATYINDSKRQVEDAYNWNALSETLSASTASDIFSYVLEGSGVRFKMIDAYNDSQNVFMNLAPTSWMTLQFMQSNPAHGAPTYYNFNGQDANGDTLVDVFPIPDTAYTLRFNVILPQAPLAADTDLIKVPGDVVILNAFARAVVERGEDGGQQSSEAYALAKNLMSDYIALESNRYIEDSNWVSV